MVFQCVARRGVIRGERFAVGGWGGGGGTYLPHYYSRAVNNVKNWSTRRLSSFRSPPAASASACLLRRRLLRTFLPCSTSWQKASLKTDQKSALPVLRQSRCPPSWMLHPMLPRWPFAAHESQRVAQCMSPLTSRLRLPAGCKAARAHAVALQVLPAAARPDERAMTSSNWSARFSIEGWGEREG